MHTCIIILCNVGRTVNAVQQKNLSALSRNAWGFFIGVKMKDGFKFSQRSLDNLNGVHPDLIRVVHRALAISEQDFVVVEGLRTKAKQIEYMKKGASKTMNSRHLTGHAVDLYPYIGNGKLEMKDWSIFSKVAKAMKKAAQELNIKIVWGGDWKKFRDGPHFELDRVAYPVKQY